MQVRYHGADATLDSIQRITERETKGLDRRLVKVADDLKLLDVTLNHHSRDNTYTAKLVLRILQRNIVASSTGYTRELALRDAFEDLNNQLDRFMAKLRREPEIRNQQRNPIAPEPPVGSPDESYS